MGGGGARAPRPLPLSAPRSLQFAVKTDRHSRSNLWFVDIQSQYNRADFKITLFFIVSLDDDVFEAAPKAKSSDNPLYVSE